MCDATGKVCANVNGKSICYYSYIPHEYELKVEPTPVCQILTNCQDGTPLIWCLERFIKQEQKHYGFKAKTVPPLIIYNVFWAIIKTALKVFSNETLPQYIDWCFNIVTGNVTSHQISQDFKVYIGLSHFMKAVSRNVKKHIKGLNIHFIMYSISVLANTKDQSTFLWVLNRFFTLLLSPTKTEMMEHAVSFLEEKIENIGHENNYLIIDENKDSLSGNKVSLEKIPRPKIRSNSLAAKQT